MCLRESTSDFFFFVTLEAEQVSLQPRSSPQATHVLPTGPAHQVTNRCDSEAGDRTPAEEPGAQAHFIAWSISLIQVLC